MVSRWTTGWTELFSVVPTIFRDKHTGLVDVMVLVLVGGDTNVGSASLGLTLDGGVLVSGPLLVELSLMLWVHLLLVLSSDDGSGSSGVLSRKNLVVLYRLYSVLRISQGRIHAE